jgi:hypothetical protein
MRRFRQQDIIALESNARSGVFRLRCPMCTAERLVLAVWTKTAVQTYTTDLDAEEWGHYRHKPPIQIDDLLRVHQMLATYEGDLSDVLEDPLFDESES